MLKDEFAYRLIQEAFDSLHQSGMVNEPVVVEEKTVLLGEGSSLDSMGFVTLITEIEDRLTRQVGKDIFFVLDDVDGFNMNQPLLTVETVAKHLVGLGSV